mmetsp:Transcript_30825/g.57047  ORF Transcript_30825/g.57047 Transcript_30825/m.57047 type:complete len:106 (+) Transcript_30825:223-540(+)
MPLVFQCTGVYLQLCNIYTTSSSNFFKAKVHCADVIQHISYSSTSSSSYIVIPCSSMHFFRGWKDSMQSVGLALASTHLCQRRNCNLHGDSRKKRQKGQFSSFSL